MPLAGTSANGDTALIWLALARIIGAAVQVPEVSSNSTLVAGAPRVVGNTPADGVAESAVPGPRPEPKIERISPGAIAGVGLAVVKLAAFTTASMCGPGANTAKVAGAEAG